MAERPFYSADLSTRTKIEIFMNKYTSENDQVVADTYGTSVSIVKNIYTGRIKLNAPDFDYPECPITYERYNEDVKIPRKTLRPSVHKSHSPHSDAPKPELILKVLSEKRSTLTRKEVSKKYNVTDAFVKDAWRGRYKFAEGKIGDNGIMTREEFDELVAMKRDTRFKQKVSTDADE